MSEAENQIILYTADGGKAKVSLMSRDGRVWLNRNGGVIAYAIS